MTTPSTTTNTKPPALPTHHRALIQQTYAQPPTVQSVPIPTLIPGSALLSVLSTHLVSYTAQIYNGTRQYPYPTPLTLGTSAVCRVLALAGDATFLRPGDLVWFDMTIRSRDADANGHGHIFLSAIYAGDSSGSRRLMENTWRDGSYAEVLRVPLENCFVLDERRLLGEVDGGGLGYTHADLCALGALCVPYGGLADVGLRAGETVIIAPATGGFGGAAVKIALAMGAGRVIALGRDEGKLSQLVEEGEGRVRTVRITGDYEEELRELMKDGAADVFFDIGPPGAANSTYFKAGVMALAHKGRVSVMAGYLEDIKVPIRKIMHANITVKGTWMYERSQIREVIKMVESGRLKLRDGANLTCAKAFALEEWEKAFEMAEELTGNGFVCFRPDLKK